MTSCIPRFSRSLTSRELSTSHEETPETPLDQLIGVDPHGPRARELLPAVLDQHFEGLRVRDRLSLDVTKNRNRR